MNNNHSDKYWSLTCWRKWNICMGVWGTEIFWHPPSHTLVTVTCKHAARGAKCVYCMDWKLQCEEGLFNILLAMSQHFPGLLFSLHGAVRAVREKHLKSIYLSILFYLHLQYIIEPFCLRKCDVKHGWWDISMWQLERYVAVTWHTDQECCYESPESPSVQPKGKRCPSWQAQLHTALSLCVLLYASYIKLATFRHICSIQVENPVVYLLYNSVQWHHAFYCCARDNSHVPSVCLMVNKRPETFLQSVTEG